MQPQIATSPTTVLDSHYRLSYTRHTFKAVKPVPIDPHHAYAVLTGDLIRSTELPAAELDAIRRRLSVITIGFEDRFPGTLIGFPEFFRGDAWQIALRRPERALRLAMLITATLRAEAPTGTRIAIGIGPIEHISPQHISLSGGEAFTLSGRALDRMTGYYDLTGALSPDTGTMAGWLPAALHLISQQMRQWTPRQAEIVATALMLHSPEHEQIARALNPPVAKQTVTKSLQGAGWRGLQDMLHVYEITDWKTVINQNRLSETGQPEKAVNPRTKP